MGFVTTFVHNQSDFWELGHKFSVDPSKKHVIINPNVTDLDIKDDIYKGLKEWYQLRGNSKYPFPIRSIGGDPTPGDKFAGDIYFMINGYRIVYDPTQVKVAGVLYSDNYDTAWLYSNDTSLPVYPAEASNLVLAVQPSLEGLSIPSADDTATAVRTELTPELTLVDASISSRATQTSVDNVQTDVTTIDGKAEALALVVDNVDTTVTNIDSKVDTIDVTINNILSITEEVLKYGKNRSRIDPVNYQMIIYENDGVTELKRYDLKDRNNVASILEIFDKVPVSGSP